MAAMYQGGKTLQEIGELFGVSRERVRQIISKEAGLTAVDGGACAAAERKRAARKAKKDAESFEKYGCSYQDYISLRDVRKTGVPASKTPTGAFTSQKNNAIGRGLEWNLKLWEWWSVWQQSGKWDQRGRSRDAYVMCRFKDDGPYEVGNVYIATLAHNSSFQPSNPYRIGHPDHDKVIAAIRHKLGSTRRRGVSPGRDLPVGVYGDNGRYRAQVSIHGKIRYLGTFPTPETARSAIDAVIEASGLRAAA